jgi:hypothetical protein
MQTAPIKAERRFSQSIKMYFNIPVAATAAISKVLILSVSFNFNRDLASNIAGLLLYKDNAIRWINHLIITGLQNDGKIIGLLSLYQFYSIQN